MKKRSPLTDTERERAKVMHAGGAAPSALAKSMGRSHHTVQKYLRKPDVQAQVGVQREELAEMFTGVAHRIVNSVTDADVEKANLVQKMTGAGIAVDKAALLRNELPPVINVTALLDVVELLRAHYQTEQDQQWREAHARIVTSPKDCIVANCPAHSPRPALPPPEP